MPIYEFNGSDSSSDFGCFTIIVEAPTRTKARQEVFKHLNANDRHDLVAKLSRDIQIIDNPTSRIIHSNVEDR